MTTTFDITILREQAERRVREINLDLSDEQQMFFLASTVAKALERAPIAELRAAAQAHSPTYVKGNCSRAEATEIIALSVARALRDQQRDARTFTATYAQMRELSAVGRQDYFVTDVAQDGENLIVELTPLGNRLASNVRITIFPNGDTAVYES